MSSAIAEMDCNTLVHGEHTNSEARFALSFLRESRSC